MDTTNLDELPSDPSFGNSSENVVLETNEKMMNIPNVPSHVNSQNDIDQTQPNSSINDQKSMNEFVSGIQQASASGATSLPSRDIPKSVKFVDEQIKPNYVPESSDYIQNNDQDILGKKINQQPETNSLEKLYDDFQIPIIIGMLYFIFQLPVVKSKFLIFLPSLHKKDGNPSLLGYIVWSFFFTMTFYVLSKTINQLQYL